MVDIVLRSVLQEKTIINDTIEFLEPDLHIITKEGATIRTNKFLIGQGSPILRSLLSSGVNAVSTPSFLFLPDVTAPAIIHFISVIKNGFTSGRGWGYPVIKQVREIAELLGFENIPLLIFIEPQEVEELVPSAPQVSNESLNGGEAEDVSTDLGNVKTSNEMETEDNQNEQDERSQNDTNDHTAASIDKLNVSHTSFTSKETHQAEYIQTGHFQDKRIRSNHILAEHIPDEHGLNEDEQRPIDEGIKTPNMNGNNPQMISVSSTKTSQSSGFNLCHFEPLNLNSARKKATVPRNPIKSNKNMNKGEIEIHEFKSQEITEAITQVLKKDPDDTSATEDIPKFPCGKCRKPFSCAGTLLVHAEKHGEIKGKRKCTICHFSGHRSNLLSHIRVEHTKEKLFECKVCQKKFFTSYKKNSHETLHTLQPKEKHFDCSVCHQQFSSCRAKNEHEKRHTSQVVV